MFRGSGTYNVGVFDLTNGVIYGQSGSNLISADIVPYTNGWYKCSITFTAQFSNIASYIALQNGSSDSYTGDGTSGIYIYGASLELGSYPTSYIPTYSVSATRAYDVFAKTSASSIINSEEGTAFVDFTLNGLTNFGTPLSLNNGTLSNYIWLTIFGNGNLRAEVWNGSVQSQISYSGAVAGGRYKMAFGYAQNDFVLYVNGTQVGTDNSGATFSANTLNRIDSNNLYASNSVSAYGMNQLAIYKERLTNAELATLTTI
jgi:hypothetical protein